MIQDGSWMSTLGSKLSNSSTGGEMFEILVDFTSSAGGLWRILCNSSANTSIFLLPTASMWTIWPLLQMSDCSYPPIFCLALSALSFFIWWISLNSRFSFLSGRLGSGSGSFLGARLGGGLSSTAVFRLCLDSKRGAGVLWRQEEQYLEGSWRLGEQKCVSVTRFLFLKRWYRSFFLFLDSDRNSFTDGPPGDQKQLWRKAAGDSYYCEVTRWVNENIGYFIARINNYNRRAIHPPATATQKRGQGIRQDHDCPNDSLEQI